MNWQGAIDTTVTGLGYSLVDIEKSAGGLLRVYIDHIPDSVLPERFITVEDCERVTRQLQHVLEVEGCAYERLEVSSPGLDRPLKKSADYARFVGHLVELTLKLPFKGRKKYRGELQPRGDDEAWRLVLEKGGGAEPGQLALDFALDEVREARLVPVVDFKGRRFAAPDEAAAAPDAGALPAPENGASHEVDGGRIQ